MIKKFFKRIMGHLPLFAAIWLAGAALSLAVHAFILLTSAPISKAYDSQLAEIVPFELVQEELIEARPFKKTIVSTPEGFYLSNPETLNELKFAQVDSETLQIEFTPKKHDKGKVSLVYRANTQEDYSRIVRTVVFEHKKFEAKKLEKALRSYLGDRVNNYGIYLYDFQREQEFGLNEKKVLPPASISKLPAAILTLRDIDSGKRKFSDTYPIQSQYKHGSTDPLAQLAPGTRVTVKELIDRLILESNNTAQYHLRGMLGGSYEELNPRTEKELRAKPFYENPHIATPRAVGIALRGVYTRETLSDKSAKYLLNLMSTTPPDLRLAIPQSVPDGVKVANKVGFLFGGREGNVYNDSAIVYGSKTDYVLVVLNNKAPAYPLGANTVREIGKIVYKALES